MTIYLDVSCLNRPFDDQSQPRVRLEAEATALILERCDEGSWQQVSSDMARIEIDAMPDSERRARVAQLLPDPGQVLRLSEETFARAEALEKLGFKRADAVHVSAAESAQADVFLSCDDRLCRAARRHQARLRVRVENPLTWLKETGHASDA